MKKLNEGPGAGYTVIIDDLHFTDIELSEPKIGVKEFSGDVVIDFKAKVKKDNYHYKAEGYDWTADDYADMDGIVYGSIPLSNVIEDEFRTDNNVKRQALEQMYNNVTTDEKESFTYYSAFLNSVLNGEQNEWLEATKDDIKFTIERDSLSIKTLRGVGYIYVPAESPMEFHNQDNSDICYFERENYTNVILRSAVINSKEMCDDINATHDCKDDDIFDDYDYEDYEKDLEQEPVTSDDDYTYDDYEESIPKNDHRLKEDMSDDGENLYVYSSSKDTDLFKYYFSNTIEHGLNASSAYGLGTYAVMEPPFDNASIGYSADKRDQIYGDNCFKFRIPTRKIFFLNWSDFALTPLCKELGATRDTFIEKQLDYFQIDPKVKNHIEELVPFFEDTPMPEDWDEGQKAKWQNYLDTKSTPDVKNSSQAQALFRLMSRYYYQNKRGSLRTPIAGFVYTGMKDGRTFVGWNAKAMIPEAFTNDLGQTWQECDKTSPEYIEYVQKAESYKFDANNTVDADRIFDGNRTPEKEGIYRLFMKFNSEDNDVHDNMAGGVFQNIVIHDDKTVDCIFKSNYTQYDLGKRFYNVGSPFTKALRDAGYKFGILDGGLKFGHETIYVDDQRQLSTLSKESWPDSCTGGFRLAGQHVNKELMNNIPTKFGDNTLLLIRCCLEEDVFDGWDVQFKEIDKKDKQCFTPDEETWNKLRAKYDWMDQVAKECPDKMKKEPNYVKYDNKIIKSHNDIEAAKLDLEAAQESGDEKAIAKAQKALDKLLKIENDPEKGLDYWTKQRDKSLDSYEKDEIKRAQRNDTIHKSWANHVDRIKKGWVNESLVNKFFEDDCGAACADACESGAVTSASMEGFIPENPINKDNKGE